MITEKIMHPFEPLTTGARALQLMTKGARLLQSALALTALATLAACSAGGAPTVVNQQATPGPTASSYTGPAAANADVQSFKINLWENIRVSSRCGGCHHEGGQSPMFARSDDVNLAYQAANPLVNFSAPEQSTLVLKVSGGHNCWVADPKACGDTMLTWIKAWVGGGSSSSTGVTLETPPSQTVGANKQFPADSSGFQTYVWTPILRQFCTNCHRSDAATPQQPYFASSDPTEAYAAAQPKIDLNTPANSRFVVRLRDEHHNCWTTPSGGAADCAGSSAAMLQAITDYANTISVTQVDPTLVLSKALSLKQGTVASGGNRYEANLVAKYEFKTGTGTIAYDTSGVNPSADLNFTGPVSWVGGWGINIATGGKAQASTASSKKLSDMITSTGEYTIEAWAAPNDVAQTGANIVSYSGSDTTRNASLIQDAMQYEGRTRSDKTDTDGKPGLMTNAATNPVQAALQHVVLTYDPVNGQKLYINGVFTGSVDNKGGSLGSWDNTFALVLGAETTGKRQWQGVLKFVAIHNRALTAAQVTQNFNAGVGERYFLLFDVAALTGVSQAYIMVTASQFDSYAYLFTNPTFISLDPQAAPANITLKGMRIGENGSELTAGQSYATLNTTLGGSAYNATSGQLLSSVGAVFASDKGVDSDMFFLSFDQIGSNMHAHTEPVGVVAAPTDVPRAPDVGIRTFAEYNTSLANVTGVSTTNTNVNTMYNGLQQSLPASYDITAFVASQQGAMAQLAGQYCSELTSSSSLRAAFFPGLNFGQNDAATYFGSSLSANRMLVITPLMNKAVGVNVNAQTAAKVQGEVDNLITALVTLNGNSSGRVTAITQAACSAVLGSGAVSLK